MTWIIYCSPRSDGEMIECRKWKLGVVRGTHCGYSGALSGNGNASLHAIDQGVNEGDTHHPYSASWEGLEATGWCTHAVREFLIIITSTWCGVNQRLFRGPRCGVTHSRAMNNVFIYRFPLGVLEVARAYFGVMWVHCCAFLIGT